MDDQHGKKAVGHGPVTGRDGRQIGVLFLTYPGLEWAGRIESYRRLGPPGPRSEALRCIPPTYDVRSLGRKVMFGANIKIYRSVSIILCNLYLFQAIQTSKSWV